MTKGTRHKRDECACEKIRKDFVVVAGTYLWNDNRKSWILRAAKIVGISPRQAKALFYGEIDDLSNKSAVLLHKAAKRSAPTGLWHDAVEAKMEYTWSVHTPKKF